MCMQVMRIWETIWAGHRSHNFELFIILAINDLYATSLVSGRVSDNVLEFFVKLSMRMDVNAVLARARKVWSWWAFGNYRFIIASSIFMSSVSVERKYRSSFVT